MSFGQPLRGRIRQALKNPLQRLFPDSVVSANGVSTTYPWQKKVLRTSDGTIHMLLQRTGYVTHYYSYDDGESWSSVDVWDVSGSCAIDKDSNDNLYAVRGDYANLIKFKKATVDKTTIPTRWSWSWGSEFTVTSSITCSYPDILVDDYGYVHIGYSDTDSGDGPWWARSIDGGSTWTLRKFDWDAQHPNYGFLSPSMRVALAKDSQNNLFLAMAGENTNTLYMLKITYSSGPTWTEQHQNMTNVNPGLTVYPPSFCILPDDRLAVVFLTHELGLWGVYFRKSTNPSDETTWNARIRIQDPPLGSGYLYGWSLMVITSDRLRVYFKGGSDAIGTIFYKESIDSGKTWGERVSFYSVGTNKEVNITKSSVQGKIDYVWRNGTADPYIIYHWYKRT